LGSRPARVPLAAGLSDSSQRIKSKLARVHDRHPSVIQIWEIGQAWQNSPPRAFDDADDTIGAPRSSAGKNG
jgi:hypothetical protein